MSETMRVNVLGRLFEGLPPAVFGGCEFVYGAGCAAYDWLVVFDELPADSVDLRCPRANTILCTWEPVSIKSYSRAYVRQFGHLLTNRPPEAENHPHHHLGRGYFPWFVHDVPRLGTATDKPGLLSAVCSAKRMRHTRHDERFRLVEALARAVPELAWYGRGVRPLARKEDALVPFRYHVAVENHIGAHHWTEKFADAILCECLPFYAGDPALTEIFPAESFVPIPIDDAAEAVRIVRAAIADDAYSRRREAVLEAKRLIQEKYNFWGQVAAVIASSPAAGASAPRPERPERLFSRRALRWRDPRALLEDGCDHLGRLLKLRKEVR
ncbi:MAG: glycosyltransferase [Kiritimatiellia bacterium]